LKFKWDTVMDLAARALTFLFFLLVIAFLGYCLYIKYIHMKYDHIPGPPRDSNSLFPPQAEKYGPVYRINMFHYVSLCTYCPEATKEILMSPKYLKQKSVYKKLFNLFGQRFLGDGLITARDHERWYKQRRIMDPAFSSLYLRGLMGTFNETAEKLMDKLAELADSKTEANMLNLINCVTLDVITKVFRASLTCCFFS
uniref:Cytochrome P450, family 46, subfamily A, polypeptide 1, tandem duplicate 4 n=1 Tax=Pundamilia nyererei TaxID=303518 RepID=A0A3B4H5G4_9CICH